MSNYLEILRRHLLLIVLTTLVVAAGTAAVVLRQPNRYDATASVQIYNLSSPLQTRGGQTDLTRAMLTQIAIVHGDQVRAAVRSALQSAPPVRVTPAGDADVLNITARASTPARAAAIANAYASAYVTVGRQRTQDFTNRLADTLTAREQALQAQIDALVTQIKQSPSPALDAQRRVLAGQLASLLGSSSDVALRAAANSLEAVVIRVAQPPRHPTGSSRSVLLGAGVLVGLLLGFAIACAVETSRRRREPGRSADAADLPVFGPVPARQLHPVGRSRNRQLRRLFDELHAAGALKHSIVAVTGATTAAPAAAVGLDLAVSLAESGRSVVVVDMDVVRPQVHQLCEVPLSPGFTDVITQAHTVDDAVHDYATGSARIRVLSAGAVNVSRGASLASRELVADLLSAYDALVVITKPGETAPEAVSGGSTVVVVDDGGVGTEGFHTFIGRLRHEQRNIVAVVAVQGRHVEASRRAKPLRRVSTPGAPADVRD